MASSLPRERGRVDRPLTSISMSSGRRGLRNDKMVGVVSLRELIVAFERGVMESSG